MFPQRDRTGAGRQMTELEVPVDFQTDRPALLRLHSLAEVWCTEGIKPAGKKNAPAEGGSPSLQKMAWRRLWPCVELSSRHAPSYSRSKRAGTRAGNKAGMDRDSSKRKARSDNNTLRSNTASLRRQRRQRRQPQHRPKSTGRLANSNRRANPNPRATKRPPGSRSPPRSDRVLRRRRRQ